MIGKASKAGEEDVNKALKSAEKGLELWRKTPPWQRAKIIRKIADLMREKTDVLAKWMTLEVGKPLAEAAGEVGGAQGGAQASCCATVAIEEKESWQKER